MARRPKPTLDPLPVTVSTPTTPPDLLAAADVLQWINDNWDQIDLEDAGQLLAAAEVVQAEVKAVVSNLRQQMLTRMESEPVTIGRRRYRKVRTFKERARMRQLRDRVRAVALGHDEATGETLDKEHAVDLTIKLMADMFVSPSDLPKVGGLQALGYKRLTDVTDQEDVGYTLDVEEIKRP